MLDAFVYLLGPSPWSWITALASPWSEKIKTEELLRSKIYKRLFNGIILYTAFINIVSFVSNGTIAIFSKKSAMDTIWESSGSIEIVIKSSFPLSCPAQEHIRAAISNKQIFFFIFLFSLTGCSYNTLLSWQFRSNFF